MELECNIKVEDKELETDENKGEQFCRLCANTITDAVYIFDTNQKYEYSLATMINKCLPVTVRREDRLPKQICCDCMDKLFLCHSFAETTLLAQDKLQALFESKYFVSGPPFEDSNSPHPVSDEASDKYCCPLCYEGSMVVHEGEVFEEGILEDAECKREFSPSQHWWDAVAVVDCQDINGSELEDSSDDDGGVECTLMYSCVLCDQYFPSLAECLEHSSLHAEANTFPCSVCRTCFSDREELDSHIQEHLVQDEDTGSCLYVCSVCGCELTNEAEFQTHSCFNKLPRAFRCATCSKSFRTKERLVFHQQFHEGATPLYCQPCAKSFPDEKRFFSHWKFVHNREKPFACDECGKSFVKRSLLEAHHRLHTGERPYECGVCQKRFHDKPSLRSHSMTHADTKPFQCDHCGKCFVKKTALKKHLVVHKTSCAPETGYKCCTCMEVFISSEAAEQHSLQRHANQEFEQVIISELFVCEFCEKYYSCPTSLTFHRDQHNGDTPYECKYCALCFETFRQLSSHKAGHKTEEECSDDFSINKMYLCNYCPKVFVSYPAMALHRHRLHTYGKPFECIYCGEKFDTYSKISDHRKVHYLPKEKEKAEKPRPFQCEYCEKTFLVESVLIKHVRMHTGEKPFVCNLCGKGFSQSSGLNTHKRVHSDERPFTCPLCGRGFKIKGDRDSHVRKHSGGRPYKCDFCGKSFMTQHVFSQHRKIHTGERPFRCDECGMAFRRSHVLTEHKRIHTGEKPHACDQCDKRYRQKGDLLKHKKTQHAAVTLTNTGMTLNLQLGQIPS